MGLSRLLLIIALAVGVAPVVATWLRPPTSIREFEKAFVFAMAALGVGLIAVATLHGIGVFTAVHIGYLLVTVSVPVMLVGWWVTAFVRRRRTAAVRVGGLLGLMVAAIGVWGTHIEPNWLRTDIVALTAPVSQPLRVGVLADMQTPNVGRHEWDAVEALLVEEPDLVLVPGDLYQGPGETVAANTADFVELLAALQAEVEFVGVVSGDSDHASRLAPIVEQAGATFVDNRILDITVAGQTIRLAGVPVTGGAARLDTIAALTTPSEALTLLLAHRPDVVFELPLGADVDLIVSGHTHGGQISLPIIGPPVTFSNVPRDIAAGGLGVVDNYPVYVSTGVGLERLDAPQVRFGVRPSVGIIDLVPPS